MTKKVSLPKPTEGELEILHYLWNNGPSTVRDVFEHISTTKNSGYTTTLKLMQIMFEKGLVSRDESKKTHIYQAELSKENTAATFLQKMLTNFYDSSPSTLVSQLLGNKAPSGKEVAAIEEMIKQYKAKKL